MANIRVLPSGSWNAQVRIKGSAPQSKTFSTEQEAREWARHEEALLKRPQEHTVYTLGVAYCEGKLRGKSSYAYALRMAELLAKAFPQPIDQITPQLVNTFKLERLKKVKPSTCRTQLAFLSRFFRYAKRDLLLDVPNPVESISLPAPSKPSDKVVTEAELSELLAHLRPQMALIVKLAYETAMRRSEITKLTFNCLHLEERIADVVDGKNGTRSVPLTRKAVELLQSAVEQAHAEGRTMGRLFLVQPHSITTAVRRARKLANLDSSVRLHQLRHTRITNVAKRGFNNAQIMIVSGHRDTRSVARYSHLNAKDVLHLID